jgi:ATP-binding cassette subfamily F protein 3
MAAPPPPAQMAQVGRRLKALGEEIETLEERWLELSTQIERLGAPA